MPKLTSLEWKRIVSLRLSISTRPCGALRQKTAARPCSQVLSIKSVGRPYSTTLLHSPDNSPTHSTCYSDLLLPVGQPEYEIPSGGIFPPSGARTKGW